MMQSQKFDGAAEAIAAAKKIEGCPKKRENLAFWLGVALLQTGDHAKAQRR